MSMKLADGAFNSYSFSLAFWHYQLGVALLFIALHFMVHVVVFHVRFHAVLVVLHLV